LKLFITYADSFKRPPKKSLKSLQFSLFFIIFCVRLQRGLTHNAKAPFFGILLLADKNAKKRKVKFLKWSVWEAQSKGISSTGLEDTVSAHTASESTSVKRKQISALLI
jgi:hypothetical protein